MSSNDPAPLVLQKFPGVKPLTEDACNFGVVFPILKLMEICRPHVNPGSRNPKNKAAWKLVLKACFDHSQDVGRSFELPNAVKAKRLSK